MCVLTGRKDKSVFKSEYMSILACYYIYDYRKIYFDSFSVSGYFSTAYYTHGKKLGNTSRVTRVNFGLLFSYNLNMH